MADLSCIYTLFGSNLSSVAFNDGTLGHGSTDDLYWIDTIHGLDGPSLRVPTDDVPFGHGGIVHRSWKGPRHPAFEGRLIVQSVDIGECQEVLNTMEQTLNTVLDSILAPSAGLLNYTPAGGVAHNVTVFYEVTLDVQPADDYRTRSFNFGLISESADL